MDIQDGYFGGKGQIFRHHINLIPPHRVFVSAYLGGCSVMRHKRPAEVNIGIDRDGDVVDMWARYLVENGGVCRQTSPKMGAAIAVNDGAEASLSVVVLPGIIAVNDGGAVAAEMAMLTVKQATIAS